MKRAAVAIAVVIAGAGVARNAGAHPLDLGYLRIDAQDRSATVTLDVEVGLAARLLGVDRDALDDATLRARTDELAGASYRAAPLTSDAGACTWSVASVDRRGTTVTLTDRAACPATIHALRWALPFVARGASTFRLLAKVHGLGDDRVVVIDRLHPALDVAGATGVGFMDFVRTGVAHIGVATAEWHGPHGWHLPDGLDHILFVLALLLGGGSLRQLASIITAFTAGHSVSLALATLGIARPPASVIEPLIALSIALVAAEAFAGKPGRHRWKVAMLFGLVHGFGFAGALAQLDLSPGDTIKALFGFNLGVEVGQLVIILAVTPLVFLAHRDPRTRVLVTRVAPALICGAGVYWFFARLLG